MNDTSVFLMLLNKATSSVISPSTRNIKYEFELWLTKSLRCFMILSVFSFLRVIFHTLLYSLRFGIDLDSF